MSHDSGMSPIPYLINITECSGIRICVCVNTDFVFLQRGWKMWGKTRTSAFEEMRRASGMNVYVCMCVCVFKCGRGELIGGSPELTFHLALSRDRRHTHTYMQQACPISRSIAQTFAFSYFTLSTVIPHTRCHPLSLSVPFLLECLLVGLCLCVLCDTDAE